MSSRRKTPCGGQTPAPAHAVAEDATASGRLPGTTQPAATPVARPAVQPDEVKHECQRAGRPARRNQRRAGLATRFVRKQLGSVGPNRRRRHRRPLRAPMPAMPRPGPVQRVEFAVQQPRAERCRRGPRQTVVTVERSESGHRMTASANALATPANTASAAVHVRLQILPIRTIVRLQILSAYPRGYGPENAQVSENRRLQQTLGRLPQASYLRLWRWGSKVANTPSL